MELLLALGVWATIALSGTWLLERRPSAPERRDQAPAASRAISTPCVPAATSTNRCHSS